MSRLAGAAGARLPAWLAPRPQTSAPAPSRRLWRAETALLLVVGLVLLAAVVYDVQRQVGITERFAVDHRTWEHYVHLKLTIIDVNPLNVTDVNPRTLRAVSPELRRNVDVACAPPLSGAQHRFCLVLGGPSQHRTYRQVLGGYDLPLYGKDLHSVRADCFGLPARKHWCGAKAVPK
jgi:hypothetical protein